MALVETTLSVACAKADKNIVVASATSLEAGRRIVVGGEVMYVTKGYVTASTTVPVRRGQEGTAHDDHVASTRVVHGGMGDFGTPGAGATITNAPVGRPRRVVNYSTTATMALPQPGEDLLVVLNSTAFTLTVPVPTKDLDGCEVTFVGSQSAAYVLEFTGGLNGASTGYETITNASSSPAFKVIACNETWHNYVAGGLTGTATNIVASVG